LEGFGIVSNVFEADFRFDKPLEGFDFFDVEGVGSGKKRYELLGYVVNFLQREEKRPFATYTPSDKENFVIGYLRNTPKVSVLR